MKILIALAAGLIATGATAQTTVVTTTRSEPSHHSTTVRTTETHHVETHNAPRYRTKRVCDTRWRDHKKVRVCRTVRVRY